MNQFTLLIVAGLVLGLTVADAAAQVAVTPDGEGFAVRTDVYTARVNGQGALSSLVIAGQEFMAPPIQIVWGEQGGTVSGLYPAPMNQWYIVPPMPGAPQAEGNVVSAAGNGWEIAYTFGPDTIDLTYSGTPEGTRGFRSGYPMTELLLSLAPDLSRACDPAVENRNNLPAAPHRLDVMVFNTYDPTPGPITHRLTCFTRADLAHSLTMRIASPNPGHLFPDPERVVFPVEVTALYGHTLDGSVRFDGAPCGWTQPPLTAASRPSRPGKRA